MHTVAVIQARMGSTRLPGKVLREIAGRPMIDWVVGWARQISTVDKVVVATSVLEREAPLVEHLNEEGIPVLRGPEDDVLARYVKAMETNEADAVVRLTGDCPLLMPEVSERVIQAFLEEDCDYASNTIERTYPRGLDTEVLSPEALRRSDNEATEAADREHVTRYIRRRPDRFSLCSVTTEKDRSDLRWTVDEGADLTLVRKIYSEMDGMVFGYHDVLQLLEAHPEWTDINRDVEQKAC
jgi:spore coat polysaccharide biosynthesis protein SpsF